MIMMKVAAVICYLAACLFASVFGSIDQKEKTSLMGALILFAILFVVATAILVAS